MGIKTGAESVKEAHGPLVRLDPGLVPCGRGSPQPPAPAGQERRKESSSMISSCDNYVDNYRKILNTMTRLGMPDSYRVA